MIDLGQLTDALGEFADSTQIDDYYRQLRSAQGRFGRLRSIQLAINYLQQPESRAEPSTSTSERLGEEDEAIVNGFLERSKGTTNEGAEEHEENGNKTRKRWI